MSEKMRVSNPAEGSEISPYDAMLQEKYMGDYDEGDVSENENSSTPEEHVENVSSTPEERVKSASAEQGEVSRSSGSRLEGFGRVIGRGARTAVEASKRRFDQAKKLAERGLDTAREKGATAAEKMNLFKEGVIEGAGAAKGRVAARKEAAKNRIADAKKGLQGKIAGAREGLQNAKEGLKDKIDEQKAYLDQNKQDKRTSEEAEKQEKQIAEELKGEEERAAEEVKELEQQKEAEIEKAKQETERKIAEKVVEQNNYLRLAETLPDGPNRAAIEAMAKGVASDIFLIRDSLTWKIKGINNISGGKIDRARYNSEQKQNTLRDNIEQQQARRQQALESRAARKAERKAKRGEAYKSATERAKAFGLSSVRKVGGALGRAAGFAKNKARQGMNAAKQTAGQFTNSVREGYRETTN